MGNTHHTAQQRNNAIVQQSCLTDSDRMFIRQAIKDSICDILHMQHIMTQPHTPQNDVLMQMYLILAIAWSILVLCAGYCLNHTTM